MKVQIMGIFNATGDSFYAPSRYNTSVLTSGADIIDIGAESTRPGYKKVPAAEQWKRLEPVLKTLPDGLTVSIDTTSAQVIERCMQLLGRKVIVNDISAGTDDPAILPLAAREGLTYIAMHSGGFFQRSEVADFFKEWRKKAEDLGISDWILDPGFGFGKDIAQNWELLDNLSELKTLGRPVLVGVSMKRMTCNSAYVTEKAHLRALEGGADILRVHNVAAARSTVRHYCSPSTM